MPVPLRPEPSRVIRAFPPIVRSGSGGGVGLTTLFAEGVDEPFGLGACGADGLVPFPARAAAFIVGGSQGVGRARLGVARAIERLARLALGLADPGERLLERALVLRQTRPG